MTHLPRRPALRLTALASLIACGTAAAEQAEPPFVALAATAAAAADDNGVLPAVQVNGRARRLDDGIVQRVTRGGALFGTSDLREVPFTVNVITGLEIANKQAKTLGEALVGDPAVRNDYGSSGAYPTESFNIRGFSINTSGMLKDGMPMANQVTQPVETVEQIEAIRGPMGFRYGFVSPGGAINLVTKRPTDQPLRSLTLTADEHGSLKAHADLGGRFGSDNAFGYRINAVAADTRNFVRPIDIEREVLAASLDWRVKPGTVVTLAADHYHYRGGPDVFHYTVPDVNGHEIQGIAPDTYFGQKGLPKNNFRISNASVGVESDLTDKLHLSTMFAVYDARNFYSLSIPFSAQPNGDFQVLSSLSRFGGRNYANTTYLNYEFDALGATHTLTGGFNVRTEKFLSATRGGGALTLPGGQPFINNFFHPIQYTGTFNMPSGGLVEDSHSLERGQFVSDQVRIGRDWRVLLALRHSFIDARSSYAPSRSSSTDPTVGIMFNVTPEVAVYASHATGLEPGGKAPEGTANFGVQLKPQKTKQVEVGAKSDLATGVTLDGSLFRIEKAAEFTNAARVYVQSGRQVHSGAELRLIGQLLPAVTVTGGVQWLHARLSGDPATAGSRPQNVPRVNASLSVDYRLAAVPGLTLNGAAYHSGPREISVPAVPAKAAGYTRYDAGVRYETRWAATPVIARLNVENLANKAYYNVGWYSLYEFGATRTTTASVEMKF